MPIPHLAASPAAPLQPPLLIGRRESQRAAPPPRLTYALISAVAGIVSLAAQRSAAVGEYEALRDAVERALEAALGPLPDPRDLDAPDMPRIADADPVAEAHQLLGLALRQQSSR